MKIFLSEHLIKMRRILRDHEHKGLVMDPEHVTRVIRMVNTLVELAREQENELSSLQRREQSVLEREVRTEQAHRVRRAIEAGDSNVVAFTPMRRPSAVTSGPTRGGAA